jgi:uncharacterized protein YggU (UPF0235/DUF167 family)
VKAHARLTVVAHPGARAAWYEVRDGVAHVYLTAQPEGGKANEAVVDLLARALGVAKSNVRIVRGHATRQKSVTVDGVSQAEALSRLGAPRA